MYYHDPGDETHQIELAPRGKLSYSCANPKPSDHRKQVYKCFQKSVALFTISRRFHEEALPLFWQVNEFVIAGFVSLTASKGLSSFLATSLDYIGPSGKRYIASIRVVMLFSVCVKDPGSNNDVDGYDTDLGVTIGTLLDMMPNLQKLQIKFLCINKRELDYSHEEKIEDMLKEAVAGLLDFSDSWMYSLSLDHAQLDFKIIGGVTGRPIRAANRPKIKV